MDRLCFGTVKLTVKSSLNHYNEKLKNSTYPSNPLVFLVVSLKSGVYKTIGRNHLNMYSI